MALSYHAYSIALSFFADEEVPSHLFVSRSFATGLPNDSNACFDVEGDFHSGSEELILLSRKCLNRKTRLNGSVCLVACSSSMFPD